MNLKLQCKNIVHLQFIISILYNVIFKIKCKIDYIRSYLALHSSILYSAKFCDKFKNL